MSDVVENPPHGTLPFVQGDILAGKYRIDRVLGLGGMGVVVAATHLQLDQKVALKFMLPEALRLPALVERFAREARAAARLKSDHVARVLDVGTLDSGSPYMVMEYLEGRDLGSIVERQGQMPIEVAVDCVLQACDAVAEAHALGIVHRDLKPRNLFMTGRNDGRALVKVLDFGISKQTTSSDLSLTRTTEIIGSPNYMSPEQLRSARSVDERSDIWALGVILYELLTAQVPFVAESVTQLTAMVCIEPPRPIESLRADVPRDLVKIVKRCLEKDPAARFQAVAQLAAALQPFAPADSRDLAVRIARIGAKRSSSSASSSQDPVTTGPGTPANWSDSGAIAATTGFGRKKVALGVLLALGAGALVVAALALWPKPPTPAPSFSAAPAVSAPGAPAFAIASAPVTTLATLPTPGTASVEASAGRPASAPPASPPGKRPVRAEPAASTGETPRYRTTW